MNTQIIQAAQREISNLLCCYACLQEAPDAFEAHWPSHRHRSNDPQALEHVDHHANCACRADQCGSLCRHSRVQEVVSPHQACVRASS